MTEKIIKAKMCDNFYNRWLEWWVRTYPDNKKEHSDLIALGKLYYDNKGELSLLSDRISGQIVKIRKQNYGTDLKPNIDYFEFEDDNFVIPKELMEIL